MISKNKTKKQNMDKFDDHVMQKKYLKFIYLL